MNKQKMRQKNKPNRQQKNTDKKVNRKNLQPNIGDVNCTGKAPEGGFSQFSPKQRERYDIEQEEVASKKRANRIMHAESKNINLPKD